MYKCASGGKKGWSRKASGPSITVSKAQEGNHRQPSLRIISAFWWATQVLALFFLAPTILAFVLLFSSSELPECSLGSRTRRRMSSFDSQILTKYFIRVEERIMNCTIWNNKKIKAGKVFDVTCDLSLYIQLLSRDTHRVKRDSFFWKGLSLRLPTEPRS